MPLKIRCPHCRKILLAEDEYAGQDKACPECGRAFNIPVPISDGAISDAAPASEVVSKCPHCGCEVAPGTSFCQGCHRDLASGRRIPLAQRLRRVPVKKWTLIGLVAVGVPLLCIVGYSVYRDRHARPGSPAAPFVPVAPRAVASRAWAEKLLAATSRQERLAALDELNQIGPRAAADVTAVLEADLAGSARHRRQRRLNQQAAVKFLGVFGKGYCETFLAEADWPADLRDEVVLARAQLGDAEVLDQLCRIWLDGVRVTMFLAEAIRVGRSEATPRALGALQRADKRSRRFGRALHGFEREAFVRIAARYWESWAWLGQPRDDVLAEKLFELAKPAQGDDLNVREAVYDLRAARDMLGAVSSDAPDAVKPVAAVLLASFAPQYRLAMNRMQANLGKALSDAVPVDQQRITWALSRISGRQFGAITGDASPTAVRHADVAAALKWIRDSQIANPKPLRTSESSYPSPPVLTRRVITVERQVERDLLARFSGGWQSARGAADDWLALGLGCTPRLGALLNPSQRSPNYPALLGAMIIVAESNETSWREPFTIWRQASDQPAWVRSLADTVLASLDAHSGDRIGDWPAGLSAMDLSDDGASGPSRDDFARVIAAGGPVLVERLERSRPTSLSATAHADLAAAARRALDRRPRSAP